MLGRKRQKNIDAPTGSRHLIHSVSRNTTVFSYHAYRSAREQAAGRKLGQFLEDERPRRSSRFRGNLTVVISITVIVIALIGANLRLSSTPKIVVLGDSSNRIFLQNTVVYAAKAQQDFRTSVFNGNKATIDRKSVV